MHVHPLARSRRRRSAMSPPKPAKCSAMDSAPSATTKNRFGCPRWTSLVQNTWASVTVVSKSVLANTPEDDRVRLARRAARPAWWHRCLVALGLVVAEHVRAEIAFPGVRAGGLVVGDPVGGQQQGGHGIDQRRLAGADVTGQQRVAAAEIQRPDPAGEGAPVVDLEPLQPGTREPVAVVIGQLHRRRTDPPSCRPRLRPVGRGSPAAGSRSRPATARRRTP